MPSTETDDYYIEQAKKRVRELGEDEFDIDDAPKLSRMDPDGENGAWVAVWLWVPNSEE